MKLESSENEMSKLWDMIMATQKEIQSMNLGCVSNGYQNPHHAYKPLSYTNPDVRLVEKEEV